MAIPDVVAETDLESMVPKPVRPPNSHPFIPCNPPFPIPMRPQLFLIPMSYCVTGLADSDIRLLTIVANLDVVYCRWCGRRNFPNDSVAPGTHEDFIPDSGTGTSELCGRMEHTGQDVEGGGVEGVYAWEWHQLYTDCAL